MLRQASTHRHFTPKCALRSAWKEEHVLFSLGDPGGPENGLGMSV